MRRTVTCPSRQTGNFTMTQHDNPPASRTAARARAWRLALMLLLQLAWPPAQASQATSYNFPGDTATLGCSASGGNYSCGPLTLAAGDTLTVTTETPTVITVDGAMTAGANVRISQSGRALGLTFVVKGPTDIGNGAHVTANLKGTDVITLGDQVKLTGDITTSDAVINVGNNSSVVGNLTTGSGAINVGDGSHVDGSLIATVAGVVNVGAKSKVTGNILTKSGAVNMGAKSHVAGFISSTLAGVVTIGAQAMVDGNITTVSGAINLGASSKVGGSVSDSVAGAITVGAKAAVGGGVSTNSGAITLGDDVNVDQSVCTGLAGAITVGDNVHVKGNVSTNDGAITVGDKSKVDGTVGAAIGAVTVASSAKVGTVMSRFRCPGSPGLKSRQWRQIFLR